jgi:hypothetical protein
MPIIQQIFAYNTGSTISGTSQVGDIAISESDVEYSTNFGGLTWWGGPDESLGYVIVYPVPAGDHPTPVFDEVTSFLGFKGTKNMPNPLSESSFVELTNNSFNQSFTNGNDASTWLTTNGYWNSWTPPPPTAYGFAEMNGNQYNNTVDISNWMTSKGSTFLGFGTNTPSTVQSTFDAQMNAYISYTGWNGNYTSGQQPSIRTSPISTTSGGNDSLGNPIVAYKFQTLEFPLGSFSKPPGPNPYATFFNFFVPVNALNGQDYSTINYSTIVTPLNLSQATNPTYYNLLINYSGNTNLPAGTYRLYTSFSAARPPFYFTGGTLV